MLETSIQQIEVFAQWLGFASPPMLAEKLAISFEDERYRREISPDDLVDELPTALVAEFVVALARPPIAALDPSFFDCPTEAVEEHFGSMWTDDGPSILVRVHFADGRTMMIRSDAQHAFMLPLYVQDSSAERSGGLSATYNPRLSLAIAALLPDGFLNKERLSEGNETLRRHYEMYQDHLRQIEAWDAQDDGNAEPVSWEESQRRIDEVMAELFDKEESPQQKAEAERAGQLSQRLLRRIPIDDVRDVLSRGADPNIADDVGQTALMHAARPPFDVEQFRLLVDAGADVNASRKDGFTGLHCACSGWEVDAAKEWLRAGANVNARSEEGATPLMVGARCAEIVRLLIESGADVNAVDDDGHSALAYAVIQQSTARSDEPSIVVERLIAAGANVDCADKKGRTPLWHARRAVRQIETELEVHRAFGADESRISNLHRPELQTAETIAAILETTG